MTAISSAALPDDEVKADYASLEEAAGWYATLHAAGSTDEQRQAWAQWLEQRPEHRRAWRHVEAVSRRFEPMRTDGQREAAAAAVEVAMRGAMDRRLVLRGLAALAGTGWLGWLGWRHTNLPSLVTAWRSDYSTGVGEQRDLVLDDGTRVWLNTGSALDVAYDGSQRLLTLAMGEILIDTAQDGQHRPFLVQTRFGRMQALGTRFTVRQNPDSTLLVVFEGRVQIRNAAGDTQVVSAGQQRQFSASTIAAPGTADPARGAWTRGVVLAENIPLETLIAELGRYQHGHLGVAPDVAKLRVVGRYPIDDPERALAMLENNFPVRVHRTLPWWITVEAR
ncbi:MAG TPA: FecR domain-containing protein [Bordetella sp.]